MILTRIRFPGQIDELLLDWPPFCPQGPKIKIIRRIARRQGQRGYLHSRYGWQAWRLVHVGIALELPASIGRGTHNVGYEYESRHFSYCTLFQNSPGMTPRMITGLYSCVFDRVPCTRCDRSVQVHCIELFACTLLLLHLPGPIRLDMVWLVG